MGRFLARLFSGSWWLDVRLGIRMLFKYPGLSLVGGFGIAVGVAIAAGGFSVIYGSFLVSSLPFEHGDRIVSIEVWDSASSKPERRIQYDYELWRDTLKSIQELSAFRTITPNLIAPGAAPVSISVASMSATGFRVARVRPFLGRQFTEEDEREGAPAVVVIAERVWRNQFASDPAIIGRMIQLGATPHTIVGVMPADFAFPVNHRYWVPLRPGLVPSEPLQGPGLMVFGRLAPGATLESAQAELVRISQRASLKYPKLYAQLQPRVMPYANPFMGLHLTNDLSGLQLMQGIFASMLVLVCLNVSILVYSRTTTRRAEIAIRTALGASRSRIVAQLFIEALVLSAVAAVAGVAIAEFALRQVAGATMSIADELPFWVSFHLSPHAVLYGGILSVAAAAIVGIVPALRVTGGQVQDGLRSIGAGASGMQMGRTWTLLIVAQVAFAVALLPAAVSSTWTTMQSGFADPGFRTKEFLTAQIGMHGEHGIPELIRRLKAEPRISAVSFAMVNPGEESTTWIESDGEAVAQAASQGSRHEVRFNRVDVDFFHAFEVPILAGRGFEVADLTRGSAGAESAPEGRAVVVNRSFAERIFGGNALGRRIRYVGTRRSSTAQDVEAGRWYEIVGIVSDFPAGASRELDDSPMKLYHPVEAGQLKPVSIALRIRDGAPASFSGRMREIAAAVDPELDLRNIMNLDEALRREQWVRRLEGSLILATTLSVLMLSSAGIYALMSITVTQRRKEVGIRLALGADSIGIVVSIFSRALGQLAVGAALGIAAALALERTSTGGLMRGNAAVVLPVVALFMLVVGLLAALGPARRVLRIEPTEALREQ